MAHTAYHWEPASIGHDTGRHVECIQRAERLSPERMRALVPGLDHRPTLEHDAVEWICKLHERTYHDWVKERCERGSGLTLLDQGDTVVSTGSYGAAIAAVNTVLTAADDVAAGRADNAFCAIRPPGHHALPAEAMGFCLFGNVAILARYLQHRHGVHRIAIVDWDVHHGNGTQHMFYDDPDVLFISLHQFPLWPGSGRAEERGAGHAIGATLNVPIAPHTGEAEYIATFDRQVIPALDGFQPEFLIISAGFDAHRDDPLAQLNLTESGYAELTRRLRGVAGGCCGHRIVSCLEGGYNLDALQASVAAHVRELSA